jgi:ribonuclease-3
VSSVVVGFDRLIGYRFTDPTLLEEALTHRSVGMRNNERLEFLGDAVLGFVIAEYLYQQNTRASEGELSRLRASLVNRDALAGIARELAIGDYLRLGGGELKSGGFRRPSILADALEAVFGAVFLDGGLEACRTCILHVYGDHLHNMPTAGALKDSKTRLQEFLQAQQRPLPLYELLGVSGLDHDLRFRVACSLETFTTVAVDRSRRKAEQEAARIALELL